MDLNFILDPNQTPKPREEIRITDAQLEAYPDGRRVHVTVDLVPFAPTDQPNIDITVTNTAGQQAAATSIIGNAQNPLSITMHLAGTAPEDEFTFKFDLYYEDETPQHSLTRILKLPDDIPQDDHEPS